MRFFHLSDLHLGIKLYEHDLLKDQKAIRKTVIRFSQTGKKSLDLLFGGK